MKTPRVEGMKPRTRAVPPARSGVSMLATATHHLAPDRSRCSVNQLGQAKFWPPGGDLEGDAERFGGVVASLLAL